VGRDVWSSIIQRIRAETDPARSQALGKTLRELGKDAVDLFFATLSQETDGAAVLRMMDLAHVVTDGEELWELIPAFLRHADKAVSAKATNLVMQRDGQAALDILLAAAKESSDAERRKLFVQVAALLRDNALQPSLLNKLDAAVAAGQLDDPNCVLWLEVLSAAGNRAIVPILTKALGSRGRTLVLSASSGGRPPREFVLAAVKAFGPYHQEASIAEILERLRKDKDAEIARIALVCFRGMLAGEHAKPEGTAAPHVSRTTATIAKPAEAPAPASKETRAGLLFGAATSHAAPAPASQTPAASGDVQRQKAGTRLVQSPASSPPPPPPASDGARRMKTETHTVSPPLPPLPSHAQREPAEAKSAMEGHIKDIGLVAALRMVAAKDGMLKLTSPRGHGAIYLVGGKILNATFTGADGLPKDGAPALTILSGLVDADFSYVHNVSPPRVTLNLEIDKMQEGLRQYRGSRTRRFDF
jgi:hypothetical protein